MKTDNTSQAVILKRSLIEKNRESLWYRIKSNKIAYLFISPWLVLFLLFTVYPIISSLYISMTDFNPLKASTYNIFIGLANYKELLTDSYFGRSLVNTFIFTIGTIPVTTVIALLLGVLLNKDVKFKTLYRIGFFFPTVTSIAVISTLFKLVLYRDGILTRLVNLLGLEGRNWLLDNQFALPSIMLMSIWGAVGYYMIIYLSAMQSIPEEQYEAATVDGATAIKKFFHITLPHLRQVTLYVIIVNTINSLQIFTEPQIMTQGGPGYATTTGVLYLYRQGFTSHRMGYASAVGYALFIIILIFTLIQMKVLKLNKGVDE